jgi:23S rRNA-intervening sequence protein
MHSRFHVGARSFSDLDVWQLSNELKLGVYELLRKPIVQSDLDFRDQVQDSARSAPRNIAEASAGTCHANSRSTCASRTARSWKRPIICSMDTIGATLQRQKSNRC